MASHPFNPQSMVLDGFVPNNFDVTEILTKFFGGVAVVMVVALLIARGARLSGNKMLSFLWFVSSGLIHIIIEGYFVATVGTFHKNSGFFDQLWKEYSMGDSRYIGGDSFVVSMEAVTALVAGPSCLLVAYAIVRNAPWRHVVQTIVCVCQLYGDVLYYATEFLSTESHGFPGHPIYFWFYFIFMNAIWIVIPGIHLYQSFGALTRFATVAASSASGKPKRS